MKVKSLCLHKTEGANNHIKQRDALVFARYPVGVTYDQLAAMLTNVIHIFSSWQVTCHQIDTSATSVNGAQRKFLSNKQK
jgi:hypothetical protein